MYANTSTSHCQIEQEILAAETKARALAYLEPSASDGSAFIDVAVRLLRLLYRHQERCGTCLSALQHRGELTWSQFAHPAGPTPPAIADVQDSVRRPA